MDVIVFGDDDPPFVEALAIRRRVFVEEQGVPLEREVDGEDDNSTHFLIRDDDPVATARARPYDGAIKAERVAVLPSVRGQGYGMAMMDAVEEYARTRGHEFLVLDAQVQVVSFYEHLNYVVTSDEFEDAGIPHRRMEKRL